MFLLLLHTMGKIIFLLQMFWTYLKTQRINFLSPWCWTHCLISLSLCFWIHHITEMKEETMKMTEFILMGPAQNSQMQIILILLLLITYIGTVTDNLLFLFHNPVTFSHTNWTGFFLFSFLFFFFLAMHCSMWDLSSQTKDQTPRVCSESVGS